MSEILACKYGIETFYPECHETASTRNKHEKYAQLCWPEDFNDLELLCHGPLETHGGYDRRVVEYMVHRTNLIMSKRFEYKNDWEVRVPRNLTVIPQPQGTVFNYLKGDVHELYQYFYTVREPINLSHSLKTSTIIRYLQYDCHNSRDVEHLNFLSGIVPNLFYQNEYSFIRRTWHDDIIIPRKYRINIPGSYLKSTCVLGVVHKENHACTEKEHCYYYGGYEYHCPKTFVEALNLAFYLCLVLVERRKETVYKKFYSNNNQSWWYLCKAEFLLKLAEKASNSNCLTFEMQKNLINRIDAVLFFTDFV